MANRYAVASGNWSSTSTWDGGTTLPTSGDVVRPNGFSVFIDQNINVTTLINNASAPAVAGGSFYLGNGIAVTASISGGLAFGTTAIISQSNSATILGNIGQSGNNSATVIQTAGSANLIISGNFNLTNNSTTGVNHSSTGILRITGSIINISGVGTAGVINSSTGIVYLTGSVSSGNTTTGTNAGGGIRNNSTGIIYVTGSVLGGSATSTVGAIVNASYGVIYVSGSVIAGASATSPITSTTNGSIYITGPISASITTNGVSSTGTDAINVFTGPFYNTGSWNAVYAYNLQIPSGSSKWTVDLDNNTQRTLVTIDQLTGYPAITDVRQGITYGPQNELTGSLSMPDPDTVQVGVLVGNTTGSAILTAQDFFGVLIQNITSTGSIGETLKNASTIQTAGATISSFKV